MALGCGIGFGLLSALALRHTTSSHAAVVVGLLPAATAAVAVMQRRRPAARLFWARARSARSRSSAMRCHAAPARCIPLTCCCSRADRGRRRLRRGRPAGPDDARLAGDRLGACVALPVSLPITSWRSSHSPPPHPSASAVAGFAYVGIVSMFVGFFAWYRGLAEAGVAKASQLQLAQPLLTIAWSVPLLGDRIGADRPAHRNHRRGCASSSPSGLAPRRPERGVGVLQGLQHLDFLTQAGGGGS